MLPIKPSEKNTPIGIQYVVSQCSLGYILVAQSSRGICAIFLGDQPDILTAELQRKFHTSNLIETQTALQKLASRVVSFIEFPVDPLELALDMRGTAFQERVWHALCKVPVGQTATYTDIAKDIGAPKSARAIAKACAANALAVVVPCHRILRSDGGLSGYRWGIERKRQLLRIEHKLTQ
jgi:AraC family transcriptional regulator, regulatory protein of adaptative response / methylated-DNA-[protein]-cysteine methyltransferase